MTNNQTPEPGDPATSDSPVYEKPQLQDFASNTWNQPAPVNPRKLFPKKKARWGLIEVTNSLIILICLQIVMALIVMFNVVSQNISVGVEKDGVDKITQIATEALLSPQMILVSSALMYISWVFMMWYSTRFRGYKSFAKDFWIRVKWIDIPLGLALAAVLVAFVQGVSMGLEALGIDLSGADNTQVFKGHGFAWELVLMIGLVGITGPIMEELFFRGFLLQGLIRHFRRGNVHEPRGQFGLMMQRNAGMVFNAYLTSRNWGYRYKYVLSALISSFIFGMMHFQGTNTIGSWLIVGITGTLGLSFAIVTIKYKRVGISMFAHIFYNSTVAIMALTMG